MSPFLILDEHHESILNKHLTLQLNGSWIACGFLTCRKAIVSLMGGDAQHPVVALDMEFAEDGSLVYANPTEWAAWEKLPIREGDFYIQTARGRIRAPTVVVARNFNQIPMKKARLSANTIFERDGGRCQYTNKALTRSGMSLDHVLPKSRGGKDTFQNLVLCDKHVNIFKADRTPEEAGLTLLRKPVAPPEVPVSTTIKVAHHPDWNAFLFR
jgi:hypothetical protein